MQTSSLTTTAAQLGLASRYRVRHILPSIKQKTKTQFAGMNVPSTAGFGFMVEILSGEPKAGNEGIGQFL
jgi:hypothetical protein